MGKPIGEGSFFGKKKLRSVSVQLGVKSMIIIIIITMIGSIIVFYHGVYYYYQLLVIIIQFEPRGWV